MKSKGVGALKEYELLEKIDFNKLNLL